MDKRYMAIGTSMLVLKLLEEEPLYGYQMIRLMEQRSRNVFQLKEGTLYPILHTLEQQGAVTSFQQTADTGKIRKYYAITPHGKKLLKEKTQEWKTYEAAVNQVLDTEIPLTVQGFQNGKLSRGQLMILKDMGLCCTKSPFCLVKDNHGF